MTCFNFYKERKALLFVVEQTKYNATGQLYKNNQTPYDYWVKEGEIPHQNLRPWKNVIFPRKKDLVEVAKKEVKTSKELKCVLQFFSENPHFNEWDCLNLDVEVKNSMTKINWEQKSVIDFCLKTLVGFKSEKIHL